MFGCLLHFEFPKEGSIVEKGRLNATVGNWTKSWEYAIKFVCWEQQLLCKKFPTKIQIYLSLC